MMYLEYVLSYLVTNAFSTYVIYLFYETVFSETKEFVRKRRVVKLTAYILFDVIISVIYLTGMPGNVIVLSNVAGLVMLTFLYEGKLRNKILLSFLVYGVLMAIEAIIYFLPINLDLESEMFKRYNYSVVMASIIDIVSLVTVLIFKYFHNKKKHAVIAGNTWLCLIIFPVLTLFIANQLLKFDDYQNSLSIMICYLLILAINLFAFIIYDLIIERYNYKLEKILLEQNINNYENQMNMITQTNEQIKQVNHDINNHLQSILYHIDNGNNEAAKEYISEIADTIQRRNIAFTGNSSIDGIVNYKACAAENQGIDVDFDLCIPDTLALSGSDITAILGNLFDNAIEALANAEGDKFISLYMRYDKSNLIITMKNSYFGELKFNGARYVTTKKDVDNHGIGLTNIQKIVDKYDGLMKIDTSDNVFYVSIILYV